MRMRIESTYPCYNKSLKNLKGEKWEDIPGLDGYYRMSNFGRLKAIRRELVNSRGVTMLYKEKILAARIALAPNHHVSDYTYHLFAHISLAGKRFHLPVRRLVYYCFIKPFDLKDKTINVICKDGNGLNVRPSNLKMISLRDATLRTLRLKRRPAAIKNVDTYKAAMASVKQTSKQISQYNQKGKKIKTYPSVMEAHRKTRLSHSHIRNAAVGNECRAGGYFWAYGKIPSFDVKSYLEKRRKSYKEKKGTKVTQYDLDGKRIAEFLTLQDAANAIGKDYTGISANIRCVTNSAYGYIWKKGWGREKIKVKNV